MRTFALIAAAGMSADAFLMKRDDQSSETKCANALKGMGFAKEKADAGKCKKLGCESNKDKDTCMTEASKKEPAEKKTAEEECKKLKCDTFGLDQEKLKGSCEGADSEKLPKDVSADDKRILEDAAAMKEECLKVTDESEGGSSLSF